MQISESQTHFASGRSGPASAHSVLSRLMDFCAGHRLAPRAMTVGQRMNLIAGARHDLLAIESAAALAIIETADRHAVSDSACINLLGVVRELLGDLEVAGHRYRQAIRADRQFEPAQQNMRRLFELNKFGRSSQSMSVGHALTDLVLQCRRESPRSPAPNQPS